MGRDPLRLRRAEARPAGRRGRAHRLLPRAPRRLQGAEESGLRPAAQDLHRQDPEVRPARAGEDAVGAGKSTHSPRDSRARPANPPYRSEEHTSELQSLMRISYAVFCLITITLNHTHT